MEKIDGQGQVVYIEPTWVTGETCLYNIPNNFESLLAKLKVMKIRKEFISRLEQMGFVITYDKKDINDESVSLIMDDTAICCAEDDMYSYKKKFDQRMFEAGGENLNYPTSLTMEEYFKRPFLPAVLKNELVNGGEDKFLIETQEQLKIVKSFYDDYKNDEEYKEILKCSIFQKLIETPTKYKTYLRLLMSASGDLMGASLKYSRADFQKREPKGKLEKIFWNKSSKYYMDVNGMFNYYSDGGIISFTQPKYSDEKQEILKAHGINPINPEVPKIPLEVASSMVTNCNRELGIICGIDFIFNEKDGKWYYLENQAFPAIEEWANVKNIRVPKVNSIDDYIKYLAIELEARYDALVMYMNKKQIKNETGPILKLK